MGCSTCGTGGCSPAGCGDNGHCATGGCNKKNTYDWISGLEIGDASSFNLMEVSFKNGSRKEFYSNDTNLSFDKGELVAVETSSGYDIGQVSLSGELVRMQMKKKRHREETVLPKVLRRAHSKDVERLDEARKVEIDTLVRGRAIIKTHAIDMKLGDVEYQGDKRKCTFYYTAEGRVDFRELVRVFAKEFKVKVEMRQIGARQESARIGGIGSCGRELCCSTWLSDFKSVSTAAARYQNLAINQAKLSGQCGRLKCCLNYELDTYMDALKDFPKKADVLHSEEGRCILIKTDIFKRVLYFSIPSARGRNNIVPIPLERVKEVLEMNKAGEKPDKIIDQHKLLAAAQKDEIEFADVTGEINLPAEKRKSRGRSNRNKRGRGKPNRKPGSQSASGSGDKKEGKPGAKKDGEGTKTGGANSKNKSNRSRNQRRKPRGNQKNKPNNPKKTDNPGNKPPKDTNS